MILCHHLFYIICPCFEKENLENRAKSCHTVKRIGNEKGHVFMEYQIRMIGLDLDGTLLTDDKRLTSYTRNVLERALKQGVTVLVATGRPLAGVPKELLEFPGMRYILTANGARVIDQVSQKILFENTMDLAMAGAAIDVIQDYDALHEVFIEGEGYCDAEPLSRIHEFFAEPYMADYIRSTRIPVESIREQIDVLGKNADKVHVIFKHMNDRKEALHRLSEIPGIYVTGAFSNSLEINREGTNKGTGLLRLGSLLGIRREAIMACGDGMNDYDMIREVGLGVAMANGNPRLKEIADYVTESNEADGVAKAIEKYVLNGEKNDD